MLKTYRKQALAAIFSLFAWAAYADGSEVSLPVSYPIEEPQPTEQSCAEAARTAVFLRELQRTDGDVDPSLPAIPQCNEDPQRT
jgi:hypothetical protein